MSSANARAALGRLSPNRRNPNLKYSTSFSDDEIEHPFYQEPKRPDPAPYHFSPLRAQQRTNNSSRQAAFKPLTLKRPHQSFLASATADDTPEPVAKRHQQPLSPEPVSLGSTSISVTPLPSASSPPLRPAFTPLPHNASQ